MADAFHQTAVAGDYPGAVIDQVVAKTRRQMALGHGHTDRRGQALTERAGGDFHSRGVPVFGVTGRIGVPLPEILDRLHGHGLEAGQVQQGVDQHRAMTGRQHETVTIGPIGLCGIVFHRPRPQHSCNIGHAHRHTLVARLCPMHRIHRQNTNGIGHLAEFGGHELVPVMALGRRIGGGARSRDATARSPLDFAARRNDPIVAGVTASRSF